ncbi:PREDICTED: uncharacterized protein LOC106102763 [Papilio polytes]|uniref:uncharacterized protein LOC106102763 n=1 Tax=Papilio polytes TaxID=76194 RepID=UPI0006766E07|nr:PREDICTED: uncharacterized protein LOC106102763 [Papilio polytes]
MILTDRNTWEYETKLANDDRYRVLMVKGRHGKYLLMFNGYTYYQHKTLRDGYRWSCTQMGSRSCRAFLHVTKEKLVIRAQTNHTHPPSTYSFESIKPKDTDERKNHTNRKLGVSFKIENIQGHVGF